MQILSYIVPVTSLRYDTDFFPPPKFLTKGTAHNGRKQFQALVKPTNGIHQISTPSHLQTHEMVFTKFDTPPQYTHRQIEHLRNF